jgi:hypothetical protein
VVQSYAAQTAARGTDILTVDALHMVLVAVLVFLIFRQVMPIASGLAGGVSLNSFGVASRSVGWGLRIGSRVSTPAVDFAAHQVARSMGGAMHVTGHAMRSAAFVAPIYSQAAHGHQLSRLRVAKYRPDGTTP